MSNITQLANGLHSNTDEKSPSVTEERRQQIIDLIIEHFTSSPTKKIKLKDLAEQVGISRQALDRYYGDLKPYISRKKDISELGSNEDEKIKIHTQNALNHAKEKYENLIRNMHAENEVTLKSAIDRHITTLMNDDLVIFHSHTIRTSLEKQTLHNSALQKKISDLELKLSLMTGNHVLGNSSTPKSNHTLIFDIDIEGIYNRLGKSPDIDELEDTKDREIRQIRDKLTKFSSIDDVRVVIFAERYISRFSTFAQNYVGKNDETSLIVRLPLFTRNEILNFIKHIPKTFKISIHVPYCSSDTEKRAQREFMFRNITPDESKFADSADTISISWGFDEVINFKITQGD